MGPFGQPPSPSANQGVSADVILSRAGIAYGNETFKAGLGSTPAGALDLLRELSALRTLGPDGQLSEVTYTTPGLVVSGEISYSSAMVRALAAKTNYYSATLKTGDLNRVHAALDDLNILRAAMGFGPVSAPSEFAIVAEGPGELGRAARFLESERQSVIETGQGTFFGSPLPWFDTVLAWQALREG